MMNQLQYQTFISTYRYGFNGMESDDEVKGSKNSYTTPFRQYDPRLGRWFSLDPIVHPHMSPYVSMDNNPILGNDPNGLDVVNVHKEKKQEANKNLNKATSEKNKIIDKITSAKGQGLSKKDIKPLKKELKIAKSTEKQAQKEFNSESEKFEIVEKAIKDLKNDDEAYFNFIDGLTNPYDKSIKINVYVESSGSSYATDGFGNPASGFTDAKPDFLNHDKQHGFLPPMTKKYGANSIRVVISRTSGGRTLKHEFGHVEVKALKGQSYYQYLQTNPVQSKNDLENTENPSGKQALEREESYDGNPATQSVIPK